MGQFTHMWVGGVGWSQTFINRRFYGIFDPFLPKIIGKIYRFLWLPFCSFPMHDIILIQILRERKKYETKESGR